jgi:hypothetical protein
VTPVTKHLDLQHAGRMCCAEACVCVCAWCRARQHTSAYGSIRQHTAAYGSVLVRTWCRARRADVFAVFDACYAHKSLDNRKE